MNKTTSLRRILSLFFIAALSVLTVACGDSNNNDFVANNTNNNNFVGSFAGANTLNNNQTSSLNLTIANNGLATGNLIVNQVVVVQTITSGTYPVQGSADILTGSFQVSGNIPGLGNFNISGTLPTGTNQGSYTLTVNGQTFTGVIQDSSLGTPNVNNNNNNNGGANSTIIQGGNLSNFLFTPDTNYNGINPPVDGESVIAGAVAAAADGTESATFILSETILPTQTTQIRTFIVSIVAPDGESLVTGQTYPVASDANSNGAIIALSTSEGVTAVNGYSLVQGTQGQATITARDTNSITIEFNFTNVGPNSEITNNPSEGTFSTSGQIVGNFANVGQ